MTEENITPPARKDNKMTVDHYYLATAIPLTKEEKEKLKEKYGIEVWQIE